MSTDTLNCRDLFLRHTDTNGAAAVRSHRVWDADRFLAAQQAEARKLNDKVEVGASARAKVEMITQQQYDTERKSQ